MKKLKYIQPQVRQVTLDVEQMVANTPNTSGLNNGDGSNGDYGYGGDDNGEGGEEWGDVKGDKGIWDDMW